jgi:hypothetical protein
MPAETASRETYPLTSLFQKEHGRLTMLQRIDEQLAGLLDQRRKVQDELRQVQQQINGEFDRAIRINDDAPVQFLDKDSGRVRQKPAERLEESLA